MPRLEAVDSMRTNANRQRAGVKVLNSATQAAQRIHGNDPKHPSQHDVGPVAGTPTSKPAPGRWIGQLATPAHAMRSSRSIPVRTSTLRSGTRFPSRYRDSPRTWQRAGRARPATFPECQRQSPAGRAQSPTIAPSGRIARFWHLCAGTISLQISNSKGLTAKHPLWERLFVRSNLTKQQG